MADIFISYAREDRPRAEMLASELARRGWTVWWDRQIQVGRSFSRVIEEELDAARCVIVIWSRHSVASDWVINEAAEGLRRGVLIPVAIEVPLKLPFEFRRLQTASLAAWPEEPAELEACVLAISNLVRPATAVAITVSPETLPPPVPTAVAPARQPGRWQVFLLLAGLLLLALAVVLANRPKPDQPHVDAALLNQSSETSDTDGASNRGTVMPVDTSPAPLARNAESPRVAESTAPAVAVETPSKPAAALAAPPEAHVTYDEYITSGGENFLAIQLFAAGASP